MPFTKRHYIYARTTLETCVRSPDPLRTSRFYRLPRVGSAGWFRLPKARVRGIKVWCSFGGRGRHGRRLRALHRHKLSKMNVSETHAHLRNAWLLASPPVFAELFNSVSLLRILVSREPWETRYYDEVSENFRLPLYDPLFFRVHKCKQRCTSLLFIYR